MTRECTVIPKHSSRNGFYQNPKDLENQSQTTTLVMAEGTVIDEVDFPQGLTG